MLRTGYREEAGREVHVFPPEVELLRAAEARMDRDSQQRPVDRVKDRTEASLLFAGEEAYSLVVLPEEHLGPNWVGVDLLALDRDVEDPPKEGQLSVNGRDD